MAQGERRSGRTQPGGIVGLAEFAEEHREALTYDLITRTHYQLEDVGGALSWGSLASFVKNLGTDSALARDLDKATGWENTLRTNAILADIYDLLQVINANFVAYASGGKKRTKVTPYPRPGGDQDKKRKMGRGALPLDQLREWIKEREHG